MSLRAVLCDLEDLQLCVHIIILFILNIRFIRNIIDVVFIRNFVSASKMNLMLYLMLKYSHLEQRLQLV